MNSLKGTVIVIHTTVNNCRPVVCTLKEVAVSGPVCGGTLIPILGTWRQEGQELKVRPSRKDDSVDKSTWTWIQSLIPMPTKSNRWWLTSVTLAFLQWGRKRDSPISKKLSWPYSHTVTSACLLSYIYHTHIQIKTWNLKKLGGGDSQL